MAVYFLSDLHLGAPYFPDSRDAERRVVEFLKSIEHDAEALYMLGDILDYWYEYRYVVPRGFVRFFGQLARMSDAGIKIVWYIGNHDIWINDYIPSELGVEVVDGWKVEEIAGKKFFLSHGDGVGKLPAGFRLIRSVFRNRLCQWMFSGIHPRWTVPFAYAWSRHSRESCRYPEPLAARDDRPWENLRKFSLGYLAAHPGIDYFIYGHLHIVRREEIAPGCEMIELGDWIRNFSYARLENGQVDLLTETDRRQTD